MYKFCLHFERPLHPKSGMQRTSTLKMTPTDSPFLQLGWEEEQIWCKEWVPPEELKGPEAHKASTLAGKTYRKCKHKNHQHYDHGMFISWMIYSLKFSPVV